jgi:hypothetical protein
MTPLLSHPSSINNAHGGARFDKWRCPLSLTQELADPNISGATEMASRMMLIMLAMSIVRLKSHVGNDPNG